MNSYSVSPASSIRTIESNYTHSTVSDANFNSQTQHPQNTNFAKPKQINPDHPELMIDPNAFGMTLKQKLLKMLCCR